MPRFATFALVPAALLMLGAPIAAQDATPASLVAPDPAECRVEPRTADELARFVAAAATPTAAASPVAADSGDGEPADANTAAGVAATARELFACYNANDLTRVLALFTDDYLQRSFAAEGVTEEALGFFLAPAEARPPGERESIAVGDVRVLEDGRVGAFIIGQNPLGDPPDFLDWAIFVEADGRWLIDDVVFLSSANGATPTP